MLVFIPLQLIPTYLSFLISDSSVEFFPLETDEVVSRMYDATLGSNSPGCIDVVTSHHPDRDAGALTLTDGLGYLLGTTTHLAKTLTEGNQGLQRLGVVSAVPQVAQGPLSQPH